MYDFGEFAEGKGQCVNVEEVLKSMHENAFEEKYEGLGIAGVLKLIQNGEYVTFNCVALPDSDAREVVAGLRRREVLDFLGIHGVAGINDGDSRSLVLVGVAGLGSGVHVDWTQALNVAFGVTELRVGRKVLSSDEWGVLAWWFFIHPCKAQEAADYSKANFGPLGEDGKPVGKDFSAEDGVTLTRDEWKRLRVAMGKDGNGTPYVRWLPQFAGKVVVVPPGWLHQVVNEQACIKYAIDTYDVNNADLYMELAREVAAKITGKRNAKDYMGAAAVIVNAIVALMGM